MPPDRHVAIQRDLDRNKYKLQAAAASSRLATLRNQGPADDEDDRTSRISRAYSTMITSFALAEESHLAYMLASGLTPGENAAHDNWLEPLREEIEVHAIPPDPETARQTSIKVRAARYAVETCSTDIQPRVTALTQDSGNLEETSQPALQLLLTQVETVRQLVLSSYNPACLAHLALLTEVAAVPVETAYRTQTKTWLDALSAARSLITAAVTANAGGPVAPLPQVQPGLPPAPVPQVQRRAAPKLAPADISFSGRIRDYVQFKQMFNEMVTATSGPYAQYQYLMGALPDEVKEEISCHTHDAMAVWQQLDAIYENPIVQVDAAIEDIRLIVVNPQLSSESMMKRLAVTFASVVTSLQRAGLDSELKSDTFIQRLTSLLPSEEVTDFSRRVGQGTIQGSSQYEKLTRFLEARAGEIRLKERLLGSMSQTAASSNASSLHSFGLSAPRAPQALSSNAGELSGGGLPAPVPGRFYPDQRKPPKCANCGGPHDLHRDGCNAEVRKCSKCGNWGHVEKDCRSKGGGRSRQHQHLARNRSRTRSRSPRPRARSQSEPSPHHRNHGGGYKPGSCRRCGTAKERKETCPGCQQERCTHCLEHCPKFIQGDVKARVVIAKAANACPHCLAPGHSFAQCRSLERKEDKDRECGVDGCKKKHHHSLHGSTDPYVTRDCNLISDTFVPSTFRQVGTASHPPIFLNYSVTSGVTPQRQKELDEMKAFALSPEQPSPCVLMVMMTVAVQYGARAQRTTITLFADTGSTCTIITLRCAKRLGLLGRPVVVFMRTVNGEKRLETHLYWLELLNNDGERCVVFALGMESITSDVAAVEMDGVKHLFSGETVERWSELSNRPTGEVDCLLGSDYAGYFPTKILQQTGHLVMAESPLCPNMVAVGTHPSLSEQHCAWNPDVLAVRSATSSHHISWGAAPSVSPLSLTSNYTVSDLNHLETLSQDRPPCAVRPSYAVNDNQVAGAGPATPHEAYDLAPDSPLRQFLQAAQRQIDSNVTEAEFLAAEELGCEAPRRCPRCKGCQDCSFRGQRVSEREEAELELIKAGVTFDKEKCEFQVSFPWLEDPALLTNNYGQALKIAEGWERKYKERGLTTKANEVFQGMIDQGMLRHVSKEECGRWAGPVHYVAIQGVESGSVSTPLRLVTNTSLRGSNGLSVNDIVCKGPDLLQDPFNIWMRFRTYEEALLSDISKAYHRLRTGLVELHTRRVLWRFSEDDPWEVYGLQCLSFGDRPAAALLEVVLTMCAEMFGELDTEAAWRVVRDRFVDDLHTGGSAEQVERFVGVEKEDGSFSGTIPQIFEAGGLRLKAVVRSHEPDGDRLAKLGSSLMGHGVSTERDELWVPIVFNFHKKKGRAPSGPDICHATCKQELALITFTRRLALAAVSGLYDPYGYIAPITIQLRHATRELFTPELGLGWDTALPDHLQDWWRDMLAHVMSVSKVVVPRGMRPRGVSRLVVVVFWDASKSAVAAVVYLVWIGSDRNWVYLCCAKAKLAPSGMLSVPRLEMLAALLASRLGRRVVLALTTDELKVEQCIWAGDSETVLAALCKSSNYFSDWFSNRILEIRENVAEVARVTHTEMWWHVPGIYNPADQPSRLDSTMPDVGPNSPWMQGPQFMQEPIAEWPLNRNYFDRKAEPEFPAEELNKKGIRQLFDSNTVLLSDLPELVRNHSLSLLTAAVGPLDQEQRVSRVEHCQVVIANHLLTQPEPSAAQLHCNKLSHHKPGSVEDRVQEYFQSGYRTNSWSRLVSVTARLFQFSDNSRLVTDSRSYWERAVAYWLLQAMPASYSAKEAGRLAALTISEEDGVLYMSGRADEAMLWAFGRKSLPVIMSETRVAYLLTLSCHERAHAGRDTTLHHTREVAWIVGGRKLAGSIAAACVRCKFLQRRLESQRMAPLPAVMQSPAPPWTYIALDYAGWFTCTKGRTTRANSGTVKVWALLIGCLATKALSVLLVPGYGTEDLLLALQTHVAERGLPLWVHTDRGSQLVKAGKLVNQDEPQWDMERLAELGKGATRWTACPAGGQWRNGQLESAVKRLKKTLSATFRNHTMSILDLQLTFRKISSMVNSRPIYAHAKPGQQEGTEFLQALTPNHLLLGRSSPDVFHPHWDAMAGPYARLNYVMDITDAWWKQWTLQNLPELVPCPRWRSEHRAVQPGDIALVEYDNKVQSNCRLARVMLQEPSEDGLIRTVVVRYSLPLPGASDSRGKLISGPPLKAKYLRLPVQRLAVVLPAELQDPVPVISQAEADAALKAVGCSPPRPPRPQQSVPTEPVPAPAGCLLDMFRLPAPPPRSSTRPATKESVPPRSRRNPRLPDPTCEPVRTRAASRLAHHGLMQCMQVWPTYLRSCMVLKERLDTVVRQDELDHGTLMVAWLKQHPISQ